MVLSNGNVKENHFENGAGELNKDAILLHNHFAISALYLGRKYDPN